MCVAKRTEGIAVWDVGMVRSLLGLWGSALAKLTEGIAFRNVEGVRSLVGDVGSALAKLTEGIAFGRYGGSAIKKLNFLI
jgi:hypothetical protein